MRRPLFHTILPTISQKTQRQSSHRQVQFRWDHRLLDLPCQFNPMANHSIPPRTRVRIPNGKRIDNSESGPNEVNNYVHQRSMPSLPPAASQLSFQASLTSAPNLTAGNSISSPGDNLGYLAVSSQQFASYGSCDSMFVQSNSQMPNAGCQYPVYTESRTILESIEQNDQTFQGLMNYHSYQYESFSGPNVFQETTAVFPPSSATFNANQFDGNHGYQSYAPY